MIIIIASDTSYASKVTHYSYATDASEIITRHIADASRVTLFSNAFDASSVAWISQLLTLWSI